jgi:hypothetical protein
VNRTDPRQKRMREWFWIAPEFTEILSAPALSRRSKSANSCTPPPTVKGMKIWSLVASMTSMTLRRDSALAVMS